MKRVCDLEGLEYINSCYFITTCGKVISEPNKTRSGIRILKGESGKGGYIRVRLTTKISNTKKFSVHRLVAMAYLVGEDGKDIVNHKDEIKHNNYVKNLEWCTPTYNNNYGNRNTLAGKAISKSLKNNEKICKGVSQYTLNGELLNNWISATEAGEFLNIKSQNIGACCLGKQRFSGGYVWRYLGEDFNKFSFERKKSKYKNRKVVMLSLEGEEIKIFDSITEASKAVNGSIGNLVTCCQGKIKYAYGYTWKYL